MHYNSSSGWFFSCPVLICKAKALLCLFPYQVTASFFVPYPGLERRPSEVAVVFGVDRPAIKTTNDFPFPPVLPVVLFCEKKSFPKEMLQSHEGRKCRWMEFEGFLLFSFQENCFSDVSILYRVARRNQKSYLEYLSSSASTIIFNMRDRRFSLEKEKPTPFPAILREKEVPRIFCGCEEKLGREN